MIGGGSNPAKKSSWQYTIKAFPDSIGAASNPGGDYDSEAGSMAKVAKCVYHVYAPEN